MPATGREWAKRPEGGPHEQDRVLQNPISAEEAPSRVYAASPLGGPHELDNLEMQDAAKLLSGVEAPVKKAAPAEEEAPAEDPADVEAEVRGSLTGN